MDTRYKAAVDTRYKAAVDPRYKAAVDTPEGYRTLVEMVISKHAACAVLCCECV